MRVAKLAVGLVVIFSLAQLVPVDRSNPPVTEEVAAPPNVKELLRKACYDCHSNETVWPWYAYVAPVSWLVAHDVDEARGHLNFSTWDRQAASPKLAKHLEELVEMVREGEMPLWYYVPMHPAADLSSEDKAVITAWASGLAATLPQAAGKASDADSDE